MCALDLSAGAGEEHHRHCADESGKKNKDNDHSET